MMPVSGESSRRMGAPALHISLEQTPHAPALARAAIAGFCDESDVEPARLATLLLLVSEVVTNAVIHSSAPANAEIILCAGLTDSGAVLVEVTDAGEGFIPVARDPSRPGGGYGLYLVEREAVSWGVDHRGGTRVWFELATRAS